MIDGVEEGLEYGNQILSHSQRNYCTLMRELLAVMIFIGKFKKIPYGRHFIVRTDHASLVLLAN